MLRMFEFVCKKSSSLYVNTSVQVARLLEPHSVACEVPSVFHVAVW